MAAVKKLHMFWAQGADKLPDLFKRNLDQWDRVLPEGWMIKVWDIESASEKWDDFAKLTDRCAHHATRCDITQTRVMRDIGGVFVGTDAKPAAGFDKFLSLIDVVDSNLVVDVANGCVMNCLAYSDGKNVDFWDCAVKHQLREGGKKLEDPNIHWATGPGCFWEVFKAHQWPLHITSIKKAYTHHWKKSWPYNIDAYVDPGYAASWHPKKKN
jgi:hypothetical protein